MEIGLAIIFGTCCSVTDCIRQKITAWTLWAGAVSGVLAMMFRLTQGQEDMVSALAALVPAGIFLALNLLTREKVGKGDGIMLLVLGLLLGWRLCLAVLCTACLLTGILAGVGTMAGRLHRGSRLPFAPFLLAAVILVGLSGRTG
ncbi:MAG: prepilin peptidase [Eisenbergiella sp.]